MQRAMSLKPNPLDVMAYNKGTKISNIRKAVVSVQPTSTDRLRIRKPS